MKALVLYYSLEGNTKALAEVVSKVLKADIEGIEPIKPLNSKGFGKYIWGGRQVIMGKTPKIQPLKANLSEYDAIFVGSPVWASSFAPPIKTVLESGQLANKKLFFFCTHDGGLGKTIDKFKQAAMINNTFGDGVDFLNGKADIMRHQQAISSWSEKCIENMV